MISYRDDLRTTYLKKNEVKKIDLREMFVRFRLF
jgi:hypothetical protein